MMTRLRNVWLGLLALASLLHPRRRALWAQMRAHARRLPAELERPLPQAMAAATPPTADLDLPEADVRRLADAVALFERRSPLGLCLRRSLLRYHYLRRAGLPLAIQFGARFEPPAAGLPRTVAGHAWVTLRGQPYHEDSQNYQGFAVMFRYPPEA